ncbi:QacE family quaternary ammonium compound efflux SMR transporter [Rhodobacterales bacterium LSUCC0031]|nr:QacE family quaternary ammonium compound efflux SMR transporter [Rhodobacterales bacterium LSUCC0031]
MPWLYLIIAITGEIVGTTALKASDGFTRLAPSLFAITGYAVGFYFLALVLRAIPLGITYAIWSGVGVGAIAMIGWLVHGQRLDLPAMLGMALIVAGVLVLTIWSGSVQ